MCDECSVFVPRLPMQGYYDEVRICRDCSPIKIQKSSLKVGTRVLVYGILVGRVVQVDAADDSVDGSAFVNVELVKKDNQMRRFALEHVELYSDAVLSANRIKNAIRQHLSYAVFRTQLNFNTWNLLETVQEQRTVQMVRILNKSTSINELHSMVPMLGSLDTMQFPDDDVSGKDRVKGVALALPRRPCVVPVAARHSEETHQPVPQWHLAAPRVRPPDPGRVGEAVSKDARVAHE